MFGSTAPRYETFCLGLGASSVVTVEHNKLTYDHPALRTMTLSEFMLSRHQLAGSFDIALSISRYH